MMISFKPSGYSREEMISAVEAMGYPYAFSGLKRRELEDFFCQVVGRSYALAVRDLITPMLVLLSYLGIGYKTKVLLSPLSYFKHFSPPKTALLPLYGFLRSVKPCGSAFHLETSYPQWI